MDADPHHRGHPTPAAPELHGGAHRGDDHAVVCLGPLPDDAAVGEQQEVEVLEQYVEVAGCHGLLPGVEGRRSKVNCDKDRSLKISC